MPQPVERGLPSVLDRRAVLGGLVLMVLPGCVQGGGGPVPGGDRPVSSPPGGPASGPIVPPSPGPTGPATGGTGVSGRVTGPGGRGLGGVFIQARGDGPGAPPVPELAVFSDPQGQFFWPLRPGAYVLAFSLQGRQPVERRVQVGPGRAARLEVVLR